MTKSDFSITIHMVSSVDGMIAKKDNSVSWFETSDHYENGVGGQDTDAFLKTIDCYVMGSHTYEHARELSRSFGWAYGDVPTLVVSRRHLPVERTNIEVYPGELANLVSEKLKPNYRNVWLVGGPTLVKSFLQAKLADEIRLSVLPVILGDGIPFFTHSGQEESLHLTAVTPYKSGMVELCYEIKK